MNRFLTEKGIKFLFYFLIILTVINLLKFIIDIVFYILNKDNE